MRHDPQFPASGLKLLHERGDASRVHAAHRGRISRILGYFDMARIPRDNWAVIRGRLSTLTLNVGDVAILPAGTGHQKVFARGHLQSLPR